MEIKYRVYSEIDQKYVTNRLKWSILPSGRLIDSVKKRPVRGAIVEPFSGCYDKYDNEIFLNDVLVVASGQDKGYSTTVFYDQGAYMVTTPAGVNVHISPIKYVKAGSIHDIDIDDKVDELTKELLGIN